MSITADKLLSECDVGGDIGQQLERVTAHAGVWTLNAFIQIFSTTALSNTVLEITEQENMAIKRYCGCVHLNLTQQICLETLCKLNAVAVKLWSQNDHFGLMRLCDSLALWLNAGCCRFWCLGGSRTKVKKQPTVSVQEVILLLLDIITGTNVCNKETDRHGTQPKKTKKNKQKDSYR